VNWEAIGAVGEIVGALAVLATLILLLKQIRIGNTQAKQANDLARADSQRDILKQVSDHAKLTISQPDLQAEIRICYKSWKNAPSAAKWNFEGWAAAYFYIVEQAIYMHDDGLLSDETYQAMEAAALRIVTTPGGAEWWEQKAKHIGAGVSRRINERLKQVGPTIRPMFGMSAKIESDDT